MTTQTKKFITPEDVIGLRIKCSHSQCQAEIVLPIDKPLEAKNLAFCPICRRPWLREEHNSLEVAVDHAVQALTNLKSGLKSGHWNFALTLEIKPEESAE